jgi:hypothetical protein
LSASHAVLALHLAIINFNLFGLVVIPIGGWLGWRFVRRRRWRLLHLLSLAAVALQAVAGRACILTIWQDQLSGRGDGQPPLIMRLVNRMVFWSVPIWAFAILYLCVLLYALLLWRIVPPARSGARHEAAYEPK